MDIAKVRKKLKKSETCKGQKSKEIPQEERIAEVHDELPVEEIKIIAFKIANEEYALKISRILEILRYQKITPVPRSPKYFKGVTFLRGRILPVIDLKYRLGLKGKDRGRQKIIVIATSNSEEPVGALVSSLMGVIRVPETELLPPPVTLNSREKSFIAGVVKIHDRFISVLNVDEIVKISFEDQDIL